MSTERLYFEDASRMRFEAEVLEVRGLAVVLRETAFYPEGGGQPADAGALRIGSTSARVVDVQVDDGETILHTLDRVPEELLPGVVIEGTVDSARRREYTALHTAQHVLSRALESEAAAPTVSARLFGSGATIDVGRAEIPEALLDRAEALARSVIDDDLLVRVWFPSASELASLPLRRRPKVEENVRVVAIGDFDFTPCGGTHTARSSALSPVAIASTERHKGLTRITFTAGPRGQRELGDVFHAGQRTAVGLKTTLADLDAVVQRMRGELDALRGERGTLRASIAASIAKELLGSSVARGAMEAGLVVFARDDLDAGLVRDAAGRMRDGLNEIAGARFVIGLGALEPGGRPLVVCRVGSTAGDAGKLLRTIATELGGKGGGRPEFAEGRVPSTVEAEAVRSAVVRAIAG